MSRVVIFANGACSDPRALKLRLHPDDYVICADGGGAHALSLGIKPAGVIGDFDSLRREDLQKLEAQGAKIHSYPADKDVTDLELALELAVARKPAEILLLTALGGRLDHLLANVFLITHSRFSGIRMRLADESCVATLLRSHDQIELSGTVGDLVSLIPISEEVKGVNVSGLKWPLKDEVVNRGVSRTISNVMLRQSATINTGEGLLLVVQTLGATTSTSL